RAPSRSGAGGRAGAARPRPAPMPALALLVGGSCPPSTWADALLEAECDAALGEVVGRHFHIHAVSGEDANPVLAHLAGGMRQILVLVVELNPEHCVGQEFMDRPRELDQIFFRHQISW